MVKERMDLLELMRKRGVDGDVDFLREALRVLVEEIMEADVSSRTGAGYGERNPERVTQRNGYRSRAWDTRVGTMELQIPKLREGSYFPSLLEPRRRSERALLAVIQQAYVEQEHQARCELGWLQGCAVGFVSHWIIDRMDRQQVPAPIESAPDPGAPWSDLGLHAPWLELVFTSGDVEVWAYPTASPAALSADS